MLVTRFVRSLLFSSVLLGAPLASQAGVFVSITVAPPILPVYVQPACPGDGYLWTPGYWAYGDAGYFWVPGTWLMPPRIGVLWTPGYWGWGGGFYRWNAGYWGPHVGFYGGVNYGFGYGGVGFEGGFWNGGHFNYNRSVTNVNITNVHNTYVRNVTVVNNTRASFNGPNGVTARPTPQEQTYTHEQHFQPTGAQIAHQQAASSNHALLASVNHGRIAPQEAAVARPLAGPAHNPQGNANRPQPQHMNAAARAPNMTRAPNTKGRQFGGNAHPAQAPREQAPRAQAPREQAPRAQAPREQEPRAQAPHAQAPRPEGHPEGHPGGGEHEKR